MTRRKPDSQLPPARLLQGHLPGLSRAELAANLTCTKEFDHPGKQVPATHLLIYSDQAGFWQAKPRCEQHPATDDVPLIRFMWPDAPCLIIQLDAPEPIESQRRELLAKAAELAADAPYIADFDPGVLARWLQTALSGDQADLDALAQELS